LPWEEILILNHPLDLAHPGLYWCNWIALACNLLALACTCLHWLCTGFAPSCPSFTVTHYSSLQRHSPRAPIEKTRKKHTTHFEHKNTRTNPHRFPLSVSSSGETLLQDSSCLAPDRNPLKDRCIRYSPRCIPPPPPPTSLSCLLCRQTQIAAFLTTRLFLPR